MRQLPIDNVPMENHSLMGTEKMKSLIFIMAMPLIISSCTSYNPNAVITVTLNDKSIPAIEYYMSGKWKLDYRMGGLNGIRTDYKTTFFEFDFKAGLLLWTDSIKTTQYSIMWETTNYPHYPYELHISNGDPFAFYPIRIVNNILSLAEPCLACYTYALSRSE